MGLMLPDFGLLDKWLNYDPQSGLFTWKISPGKRKRAGSVAGRLSDKGYIVIQFQGKDYRAHRLAWLLHYKEDPGDMCIDHIDGKGSNNAITNLRLATSAQNRHNSKSRARYKGAVYRKRKQKWQAYIQIGAKYISLGYYDSGLEAHMAWRRAAEEYHGEFLNPKSFT